MLKMAVHFSWTCPFT